jgi:hypothetical protein
MLIEYLPYGHLCVYHVLCGVDMIDDPDVYNLDLIVMNQSFL